MFQFPRVLWNPDSGVLGLPELSPSNESQLSRRPFGSPSGGSMSSKSPGKAATVRESCLS